MNADYTVDERVYKLLLYLFQQIVIIQEYLSTIHL